MTSTASRGRPAALALVALLLLLTLSGRAVSAVEVYPYGEPNGDTTVVRCNDAYSPIIPLPFPVPVFGTSGIRGLLLSLYGTINFRAGYGSRACCPREFPLDPAKDEGSATIAIFWDNVVYSNDACGNVTYRVVDVNKSTPTSLAVVDADVRATFPDNELVDGFSATAAVVATWADVRAYDDLYNADGTRKPTEAWGDRVNTFQAVVAFDASRVFFCMLYPQDGLRFGASRYNKYGLAGFDGGDGVRSFALPGASTNAITDLPHTSNVGQPGKWCFGLNSTYTAGVPTNVNSVLGGPYLVLACGTVSVSATAGTNGCGMNHVLEWDFDNDGAFDDATGSRPVLDAARLKLAPGVHTIRVRASSVGGCGLSSNPAQVLSTTVTVARENPQPTIVRVTAVPESGNAKAVVGESVAISVLTSSSCLPVTVTVDCGADSVLGLRADTPATYVQNCKYEIAGVKQVTATLSQYGNVVVSRTISIQIDDFKPMCPPTTAFLEGRVLGRQSCTASTWNVQGFRCNYPSGVLKPSTTLYSAFASRASQDAATIKGIYGERTIAQALHARNTASQLDRLAHEAAAALLNSLTCIYPACPNAIKLAFRHALYRGANSAEVAQVLQKFTNYNNDNQIRCPLSAYC